MSERTRSPESRDRGKRLQRAITRADVRLRAMFPREYRAFLNEERAKEGLPPVNMARPGGRARRS